MKNIILDWFSQNKDLSWLFVLQVFLYKFVLVNFGAYDYIHNYKSIYSDDRFSNNKRFTNNVIINYKTKKRERFSDYIWVSFFVTHILCLMFLMVSDILSDNILVTAGAWILIVFVLIRYLTECIHRHLSHSSYAFLFYPRTPVGEIYFMNSTVDDLKGIAIKALNNEERPSYYLSYEVSKSILQIVFCIASANTFIYRPETGVLLICIALGQYLSAGSSITEPIKSWKNTDFNVEPYNLLRFIGIITILSCIIDRILMLITKRIFPIASSISVILAPVIYSMLNKNTSV